MIKSLEGLPVLFEVFCKSGVVLGAALCISLLLRKKSADLRRLVLSTAIVAMLVAAMASAALPRWIAVTPAWFGIGSPAALPEFVQTSGRAIPGGRSELTPFLTQVQPESHTRIDVWVWISNRIPPAIPLIWLLGTSLFLVRFVVSLRGLRRLRKTSEAVRDTDLLACLDTDRSVALMQNKAIAAPLTWGVFRPVILVPAGFEQLPTECRDAVLCHELAHIQGNDFFLRSLAEIACALIWFQPLMWITRRQLREEQELACDNRVLAAGGKPSTYAKLLMDWNARPGLDSLIAVGITHRGCLKRRLYALLDPNVRRDRVAAAGVLSTWFLGLATALPLAAITLTSALPVHTSTPPIILASPAQAAREPVVQLAQVQPPPAPVRSPAPKPADTSVGVAPMRRFLSNVTLVIADASATDKNGKVLEGLKADDFLLTEDGVPQVVSVCEFQKLDDTLAGSYYVLGYYTSNLKTDGSFRKLKIALKADTTAKLDYRAGYYASNKIGDAFTVDGVTDLDTGTSTTGPSLRYKVDPVYSEQARKAKYSGSVVLGVEVDASGQVTNVKVVKSLGMGLDEKAIEAVRQWKFQPGTKNGTPIPTQSQVEVNFRLL